MQQLQHYLNRLPAKSAWGCWRRESATEWGSLNKATFKTQHGLHPPRGLHPLRLSLLTELRWPKAKRFQFRNVFLIVYVCVCLCVCVWALCLFMAFVLFRPDRSQSKSCGRFAHINIFRAKARFVFAEMRVNCFHLLQSQSQNVNENENETKNAVRLLNS